MLTKWSSSNTAVSTSSDIYESFPVLFTDAEHHGIEHDHPAPLIIRLSTIILPWLIIGLITAVHLHIKQKDLVPTGP